MYGYDYKQTTYGFFILPPELQTQTFHINYLDIVRNSNSYTQISTDQMFTANSGDISNATSPSPNASPSTSGISKSQVTTNVQLNFWTELTTSLQALVGTAEGRSVIVNPGSGTIIVKAFPSELRQVSEFLDQIQSNMSREVILEVKLLEVRLNDQYEAGINWDVFGFKQGDILNVISNDAVTAPPLTSVNIHGSNFTNVMNLLEQQGTVQTIANPRVLTVNNQQAVIRIGTDQFFVTGITTNVNNNGSTNTVTTASVGLTPFFSGVILDITPQIGRNGDILLHLHPVVSDVTEETKRIDIGATQPMELPLAKNNIREYDSIVRAENNQIILIGGLTQNTLREEVQGTPGASHIPFVGGLFRNTGQASDKVELVILLKPTVLGRGRTVMTQQLPMAAARISQLDRGFQFGSMPEIFGNQAEIPNYERDTGQLNEE
jgi:MSHA biogenesis protein MshL